jgi:hypothetical protein
MIYLGLDKYYMILQATIATLCVDNFSCLHVLASNEIRGRSPINDVNDYFDDCRSVVETS